MFLFDFFLGGGGCVFFLFLFFVFVGGFKGQVRWPKGPPRLALNPPYFVFVFLGFCLFLFCFCFCLEGLRVRWWPNVPPHLALNPPYFLFFCVICFAFLTLLLIDKPVFPLKKAIFVVRSSVFPFVSL